MTTRHVGDMYESRCREMIVSKMELQKRHSELENAKKVERHCADGGALENSREDRSDKDKERERFFLLKNPLWNTMREFTSTRMLGTQRTELTSNCCNNS
jgi:hypothetical protein